MSNTKKRLYLYEYHYDSKTWPRTDIFQIKFDFCLKCVNISAKCVYIYIASIIV